MCGQNGVEIVSELPRRDGGLTACPGHILRRLHTLVLVDVARAVPIDFGHLHPDDELGSWVRSHQGLLVSDAGDPLHTQSLLLLKVDEQHPHVGILQEIPHGLVFPVAVVVRKRQPVGIHDADKAWIAAFIRARRQSSVITRRQEEHIGMFDKRAGRLINMVTGAWPWQFLVALLHDTDTTPLLSYTPESYL